MSRLDPAGDFNGFSAAETDSSGFKAFFGKHFKPRWRWELGYTDAGVVGMANPAGSAADKPEVGYKIPSLAIDYLLRAPENKLNFYLRGGAALLQTDPDDTRISFEDESKLTGLLGAGVQWGINDRFQARFGVDAYGADVSFASLSLAAKLGRKAPRQMFAAAPAEPVPVEHSVAPESAAESSQEAAAEAVLAAEVKADQTMKSEKTPEKVPISSEKHQKMCKSVDRELRGVSFEPGSTALTARARHQLEKVAVALRRGPNIRVTVRGFTDTSGNSQKNLQLSEKRAQAVANYLMLSVGNFNNSPKAVGMGEASPIASNDTAVGRARNRRIELNLQAGDGCAEVATSGIEIDDKARLSAERIVQPLLSKAVPTAALTRAPAAVPAVVPAVIPDASVQAQFQSGAAACEVGSGVIDGLHFGVGEYQLDAAARRALSPLLAAMRDDSTLRVQIKGHTDASGRADNNQLLSARRARSVADYLMVQAPHTASTPGVIGEGEAMPIASNATAAGRARNRRIEVALSGGRNCHLPAQQLSEVFKPAMKGKVFADKLPKTQPNVVAATELVKVQGAATVAVVPERTVSTNLAVPEKINNAPALKAAELGEPEVVALRLVKPLLKSSAGADVAPPVQALVDADEGLNALAMAPTVFPEPVAEPTLSDTLTSADGEKAVVASASCTGINRIVSGVKFRNGSTSLTKASRLALDPVVQLLRRDPLIIVTVEGHTDNFGDALHNMSLSESRAKVVAAYLAGGAGLVKNPPFALGYGETKPLVANNTATGRERNRRIAIKMDGGHSCLSNEMLAGVSGLEEVPPSAVTHSGIIERKAVVPAVPQTQALSVQPEAPAAELFVEAMGRVSRGHGACGKVAHVVEGVGFNPGDHRLDISDQRALMPLVTVWRENPALQIEVRGHTDNIGSATGNRRLSQRRAESVAQFLMFESGLVEDIPAAHGMGESLPRASNDSNHGRQLNRRIEVVLNGGPRCDVAQVEINEQQPKGVPALALIDHPAVMIDRGDVLLQSSGGGSSPGVAELAQNLSCDSQYRVVDGVSFGAGSSALDRPSRKALDRLALALTDQPDIRLEVHGHTDARGEEQKNLNLSQSRAQSVARYLSGAVGQWPAAPVATGYGETRPLASNDTFSGRATNRRIELKIDDRRCA